jgi:hypothetical protein
LVATEDSNIDPAEAEVPRITADANTAAATAG